MVKYIICNYKTVSSILIDSNMNLIKLNNLKYQLKNGYKKSFLNYKPYLYIHNNKYIKNNLFKSLFENIIFNLPKNKLIINKIYNITLKKSQRMGKGKGKILLTSTYYYGNKPIWLYNNIKYNSYKIIYLKYVFNKLTKKYSNIGFK